MKYADLINALDRLTIYTPALVARFADERGYIEERDPAKHKKLLLRIRIAMGRFSNNKGFHDAGDGVVTLKGQAPTPGWYGWHWQQALPK